MLNFISKNLFTVVYCCIVLVFLTNFIRTMFYYLKDINLFANVLTKATTSQIRSELFANTLLRIEKTTEYIRHQIYYHIYMFMILLGIGLMYNDMLNRQKSDIDIEQNQIMLNMTKNIDSIGNVVVAQDSLIIDMINYSDYNDSIQNKKIKRMNNRILELEYWEN